jgi:hypothetical protein
VWNFADNEIIQAQQEKHRIYMKPRMSATMFFHPLNVATVQAPFHPHHNPIDPKEKEREDDDDDDDSDDDDDEAGRHRSPSIIMKMDVDEPSGASATDSIMLLSSSFTSSMLSAAASSLEPSIMHNSESASSLLTVAAQDDIDDLDDFFGQHKVIPIEFGDQHEQSRHEPSHHWSEPLPSILKIKTQQESILQRPTVWVSQMMKSSTPVAKYSASSRSDATSTTQDTALTASTTPSSLLLNSSTSSTISSTSFSMPSLLLSSLDDIHGVDETSTKANDAPAIISSISPHVSSIQTTTVADGPKSHKSVSFESIEIREYPVILGKYVCYNHFYLVLFVLLPFTYPWFVFLLLLLLFFFSFFVLFFCFLFLVIRL